VRPVQDASLVSFSHALCSLTVKSEQLRQLLQWDVPPPSRLVTAQLMKMADVVNKLSPETNVTYSDVLTQYRLILAHLFDAARRCQSTHDLLPGWTEAKTPEGKTYYVNTALKLTQWERPEAPGSNVDFASVIAVLNDLEQPLALICKNSGGTKHPVFCTASVCRVQPSVQVTAFSESFPIGPSVFY
jgi:hypothetical protein